MRFAMSGKPSDRSARAKDGRYGAAYDADVTNLPCSEWAAKLTGETCAASTNF